MGIGIGQSISKSESDYATAVQMGRPQRDTNVQLSAKLASSSRTNDPRASPQSIDGYVNQAASPSMEEK